MTWILFHFKRNQDQNSQKISFDFPWSLAALTVFCPAKTKDVKEKRNQGEYIGLVLVKLKFHSFITSFVTSLCTFIHVEDGKRNRRYPQGITAGQESDFETSWAIFKRVFVCKSLGYRNLCRSKSWQNTSYSKMKDNWYWSTNVSFKIDGLVLFYSSWCFKGKMCAPSSDRQPTRIKETVQVK